MKTYIFVDLDETLIHTFVYPEEPCKLSQTVVVDNFKCDTTLRPGALEFLAELRKRGETYMLTIATKEYALEMNRVFSLGFPEEHIYSRRDVSNLSVDLIPAERSILFDNLSRHENRKKIEFLRKTCKTRIPEYIQVQTYLGGEEFPFSPVKIKELLKQLDEPHRAIEKDTKRTLDNLQW